MICKTNMCCSSSTWMMNILLILLIQTPSIDTSYQYAGCFTQVFYDTFFTSSFMEPTLCFRLCDTPIVYLQKSICRCSGGGLMHQNRKPDKNCLIPCSKAADRQVTTSNTCGGQHTYSAYVEKDFYIRHGHLFNYQINFFACELWNTNDVYDTFQVNPLIISSLNKLERCAAACLDNNTNVKSIAFNGDNNQCLCIMPWKSGTVFKRTNYLTILPATSCNRYCNNTSDDLSSNNPQFQCGSLNEPRIWAIYDLNGTCPMEYVFIQEIGKCMHTYRNFWNSCTPPAKSFIFDESMTWPNLLKAIERLKLTEILVTIDFDEDVMINSSWKCPSSFNDRSSSSFVRSYSNYYSWNSNTRYILDNGCLKESSYTSYAHRYSNRLCIANPMNKYSLTYDDQMNTSDYISYRELQMKFCPNDWFDLNSRCYRMSDERKTIQQARNSCITIQDTRTNKSSKSHSWWSDEEYDDYDEDQLNDSPRGEIVQYTSEWQARLGFFLLDTIPESDLLNIETSTISSNVYYQDFDPLDMTDTPYHSPVNEFQMINPNENKSSLINDATCVIAMRISNEDEERPLLQSNSSRNCSLPKNVLCETSTLIVRDFQQVCYRKPLILDLPALISNQMKYELCLSVCQELQTKIAIIQVDKCYCLNEISGKLFNLTADSLRHQKNTCGNICLGNRHERCGDENTIVVFHILDPRRRFMENSAPVQIYPDFSYDSCIFVKTLNISTTYQFDMNNVHPRHCLELCIRYNQTYALMNGDQCFCTNVILKDEKTNQILTHEECAWKCSGNYFYTCGSQDNSTKYSMYIMKPQCRHGFDIAANDQQCVYSHLSIKKNSFANAQAFCQSINGHLAKINDISEMNYILADSIFNMRLLRLLPFSYSKLVNSTRYFWVNRTSENLTTGSVANLFLRNCQNQPEIIDRNCIAIRAEPYQISIPYNLSLSRLCVSESDQCATESAMPFCVDQHVEPKPTIITSHPGSIVSNITIDYSCGDDPDYHFIDDYCYKIKFHEVSWNDGKAECEKEQASLFVPEKANTLHMIKTLFLHRNMYQSTGFAHVGVIYDNRNRTVVQYVSHDGTIQQTIPDSNTVYDICEKSFNERYSVLMSSGGLSLSERNRLKTQQLGCGYLDLLSYSIPIIRCDEIPCNRTAVVICQKSPRIKTMTITAERNSMIIPSAGDSSENIPTGITRSIARDFAPIFFILATLFALVLLGLISTLCNQRMYRRNQRQYSPGRHHNLDSVYSPLTSANEFDLH